MFSIFCKLEVNQPIVERFARSESQINCQRLNNKRGEHQTCQPKKNWKAELFSKGGLSWYFKLQALDCNLKMLCV
jgi:hypothetical protein